MIYQHPKTNAQPNEQKNKKESQQLDSLNKPRVTNLETSNQPKGSSLPRPIPQHPSNQTPNTNNQTRSHKKKMINVPGNTQPPAGHKPLCSSCWLNDGTRITTIARDAKVSPPPATGYRYIHEALTVVAAKLPRLTTHSKNSQQKANPSSV